MLISMVVATPVAPFTGAWIEIGPDCCWLAGMGVAPFTGAWIEIVSIVVSDSESHVAPFTGAWIEMILACECFAELAGRSLHGSVDWEYCYEWLSACGKCTACCVET